MHGLPAKLPAPDELVKLPVTALATLILTHIERVASDRYVGRAETVNKQHQKHWGDGVIYPRGGRPTPPRVDRHTHAEAISTSFDWLYIEGLICKLPARHGSNDDEFTITERGVRFLERGNDALDAHRAEKLLGFQLHETIDRRVRQLFLTGETEAAVMIAMKEVEIHMRDTSGLGDQDGQVLAGEAFKSAKNGRDPGPLTDPNSQVNEQDGVAALFRGAMATFRNPVAHRRVDYDDPVEAVEVILFADLLLRMIDRAKDARA